METVLALLVGLLFAISAYLLLSSSLIRLILGVFVLGNATHLMIFVLGRLTRESPPLIQYGLKAAEPGIANPLPQALILTAIVISFSLFEPDVFAELVPWLALNRRGLTLLLHPETGDALADHSTHVMWLGESVELNLDALR